MRLSAIRAGASAVAAAAALSPPVAHAQDIAPASETTVFIFATLLALIGALALPLAAGGFAMIESGLSRAPNAASAALKIALAAAIAPIALWANGMALIDGVESGGLLGDFGLWFPDAATGAETAVAPFANFLRACAFAFIAAAIVSGALAERIRLWPYALFAALICALIQPIVLSWTQEGYLAAKWAFVDLGGAAAIHAVGGAAALAGVIVIGPRRGRYAASRAHAARGSSAPFAIVGGLALAVALIIVAAARHGALGSAADAVAIAAIVGKSTLAAAGAAIAAAILMGLVYRKVDPTIIVNAAIGGIVSLSGDPLAPQIWQAVLVGAFGGVIVAVAVPFMDRLRLDDVTGAAPTHLLCGVWGAFAVAWTQPEATFLAQTVGIAAVVGFAFAVSMLAFIALKYSIGLRPAADAEALGLDRVDCGVDAYPEFRRS